MLHVHRESRHCFETPGRWFLALQEKLNAHGAPMTEVPTSGTRLSFPTGLLPDSSDASAPGRQNR